MMECLPQHIFRIWCPTNMRSLSLVSLSSGKICLKYFNALPSLSNAFRNFYINPGLICNGWNKTFLVSTGGMFSLAWYKLISLWPLFYFIMAFSCSIIPNIWKKQCLINLTWNPSNNLLNFRSLHICNLFIEFRIYDLLSYVSFMSTVCARGIDDPLFLLWNNTVFKLIWTNTNTNFILYSENKDSSWLLVMKIVTFPPDASKFHCCSLQPNSLVWSLDKRRSLIKF